MSMNVVSKLYALAPPEECAEKMTLEQMQQFVGGDIEMVRSNLPRRSLIVNENGVYENLPINGAATALVAKGTSLVGGIRGNALLVKSK